MGVQRVWMIGTVSCFSPVVVCDGNFPSTIPGTYMLRVSALGRVRTDSQSITQEPRTLPLPRSGPVNSTAEILRSDSLVEFAGASVGWLEVSLFADMLVWSMLQCYVGFTWCG